MNSDNNKLSKKDILFLILILICIILAGKIDTFFLQNGIIY